MEQVFVHWGMSVLNTLKSSVVESVVVMIVVIVVGVINMVYRVDGTVFFLSSWMFFRLFSVEFPLNFACS